MSDSSKLDLINRLRDMTGAGVMEAKKALEETSGDIDKAASLIVERSAGKVEKREGRTTGAGHIETYVHQGRIGVMLEIRAETDFVVKSDVFQQLAKDIIMHLAAMGPETVEELLAQPYVKDDSKTIASLITDAIGRTGEKIEVARFVRFVV